MDVKGNPKTKEKNKVREQLWGSLFKVYEKEAVKDCEEVIVDDIEQWSLTHLDDSLKALPQLARINPQLASKAFSKETQNQNNKEGKENNQQQGLKKKANSGKSFIKYNKQNKKVLKTTFKINPCLKKSITKKIKKTNIKSKKDFKKGKKQKIYNVGSSPESYIQSSVKKPNSSVKKKGKKEHKCRLKWKYPSDFEVQSMRADGRIFRCKLILKVSQCCESDESF